MKKIIATLSLISLLAIPAIALADVDVQGTIPESTIGSEQDLFDLMDKIGGWIFTGLLVLATIFMVVAGYFFITAGGEPLKVTKARQMLINALIGLAVGFGARGLIAIIEDLLRA